MTRKDERAARGVLLAATLAGALLSSACATLGEPEPPEAQVAKLAKIRWEAAIAGDFEKIYSLTMPSYRAVTDYKLFRSKIGAGVVWKSAEVVDVNCAATACKAKVRIDFVPLLGGGSKTQVSTHFDERWVQEEGKWWLYQN